MLRLLLITTSLGNGGAERSIFNLISRFNKSDIQTLVVSLGNSGIYGDKLRLIGINVDTLDLNNKLFKLDALIKLYKIVNKFKPNIIQGWMYHGNLAASIAGYLSKNRPVIIWNIRQSLYNISYEKFLTRQVIRAHRIFSKSVNTIIYNSQVARDQHENFGIKANNTLIINNGFDTYRLKPDDAIREKYRNKLGIVPNSIVVGHAARFHPMKDHAGFLKAAVEISRNVNNVHFVLLGKDITYDNSNIVNIIPKELANKFNLLGERNDAQDIMQSFDIFCLSSAWGEAFPNVIGEAMSVGIPCIVTDVGDCASIVKNTGIVVPPRNEKMLYDALKQLIEMNAVDRKILKNAAHRRISVNYSLAYTVLQYKNLYTDLANV